MTDAHRLALVRGFHTAIYVVMAASVFVVLYAGVTGVQGDWLLIAAGLVSVEVAVFAGSGMKCPLTAVAARYGPASGRVSDTYLPERLTRHTFAFFTPLIVIGFVLLVARWLGILR